MTTKELQTRINVTEDSQNPEYFRVVGEISFIEGMFSEVIIVNNHNIKKELRVTESKRVDGDIVSAIALANLQVDTINKAIVEQMKRAVI